MNLRHLRYVAALAREGHNGRAALACDVPQPTLTRAVRQLKAKPGVPLVERGGQRHALTPEGRRVLAWAQRMLAGQDGLGQDIAGMRHGLAGRRGLPVACRSHI